MEGTSTFSQKLKPFAAAWTRHAEALRYVLTVILPAMVMKRRRPVIFSRFSGMGDIICTIPAARKLMERHSGAAFIYNCHPDFAELPSLAGVADQVTSLKSIGAVGHWYRFLLGGFYHFAHGDDTPGKIAEEPMVAEFCRQFDVPVTDRHPELSVGPVAAAKARNVLAAKKLAPSELIVIHPGRSWAIKEWPRESWARLVAELRAGGHTQIAQLGVGHYATTGNARVDYIPGVVSLVDALSIEESIAVISLARLFVGIDSGLLHIAACTRTPAVGLFGPTDPQFFYEAKFRRHFLRAEVECAGCEHRRPRLHWLMGCPYDVKCMQSLTVNDVLKECLAGLETVPHPAAGGL